MKRVTRPGGVVASGVHQFYGGMPAFDLVHHTGAVLDAGIGMRNFFKGRPLFWANGQADLWRKTFRSDGGSCRCRLRVRVVLGLLGHIHRRPGPFWSLYVALSNDVRGAIEQHVRDGYLVGLPDGPRSFPMMCRVVRGIVPR